MRIECFPREKRKKIGRLEKCLQDAEQSSEGVMCNTIKATSKTPAISVYFREIIHESKICMYVCGRVPAANAPGCIAAEGLLYKPWSSVFLLAPPGVSTRDLSI